MDISKFLIKEPKGDKAPSVSLTMLLVMFIVFLVAIGLDMAGKVKSTSIVTEGFYAILALYFGRRFNIGGKQIGMDKDG